MHENSRGTNKHAALLALALFLLSLAVFGQAVTFSFLEYDDGKIVYENEMVVRGLDWETVRWAFSDFHFGLYMPLTSLTHLLDVSLYGLWAGGHHLTSVLLHAVNGALLLLALRALTGRLWLSFAAAALFALHPLRMEAVVWIASRKDLVAGFFCMLCLLAYARYARNPGWRGYLLVLLTYVAALLGKPSVIPLPLALLALDWWPLERRNAVRLLLEKVPLLLLAAGATLLTLAAEQDLDTLVALEDFPLRWRVGNAILSYARYLGHFLFPWGLSIHYPHIIAKTPALSVAAAGALLIIITMTVLLFRRRKFLLTGWAWYLVMLVPVIGLVQFGNAALASRFMYLPQIGLNVAAVWAAAELLPSGARQRKAGGAAFVSVLAFLTGVSLYEARHWRDTRTVFSRALDITGENALASLNLGKIAFDEGEIQSALQRFHDAVRLEPANPEAQFNLGSALLEAGRYAEAASALEVAARLRPQDASAHMNLGITLLNLGQTETALAHLAEAVRLKPGHVNARVNYGVALLRAGRKAEARRELDEALQLDPSHVAAQANRALL